MKKYDTVLDGESFEINIQENILYLACCDCGLVHKIEFKQLKENIISLTFVRESKETKQLRKYTFNILKQLTLKLIINNK